VVLTLSENGYGKRSSAYEIRITGRGGKGIVAMVVNERNGKLIFPLEGLNAVYENRTRSELIHETNRLIREINIEWEPFVLKQITGAAFREWKMDTSLLIGLISGGPN